MKTRNSTPIAGLLIVAFATSAYGQEPFDHLKCYKLKDTIKASYEVDLIPESLPPFSMEPGCTVRLPAKFLCIDIEKTNVVPDPVPVEVDAENGRDYLCYKVKCPAQTPQPPLFVQDQFGERNITIRGAQYLCTPAVPECGSSAAPECGGFCANGAETCHQVGQACACGLQPLCPSRLAFATAAADHAVDIGWTGQTHDATLMSNGTVTVDVTCAATSPPCGVCGYSGPVENAAGELHVHRCQADSSITCVTDTDCGGSGPCVFFFGTYLPLAGGGVSTCVENTFNGSISGTVDIEQGSATGSAAIVSRVFSGATCPHCNGDATPNDGVKGGACSFGARPGLACDASGSSPNASFGTTSLDCPPLAASFVAALPIDVSNTTGNKIRTLTAANPNCRAPGFSADKCQCDTCNNAAATPCSSNAECVAVGATICGGARCAGGINNGAPCTSNSECPASACAVPGAATAPNQCAGGSGDCVADAGTPSPNDRICASGPFEQFCGPTETFRGCTLDGDCTFPGDTCSIGRSRDCFDNGVVGEVVTASGNPSVPVSHEADPTLAALSCVGATSSTAVNAGFGLPGLQRLELRGHWIDNGTP